MTYRKKTLRTMSPTARKVARLAGELDSVARRLKNLVPELQALEFAEKALISAATPLPTRYEKVTELHITTDPTTGQVITDQEMFDRIPSLQ